MSATSWLGQHHPVSAALNNNNFNRTSAAAGEVNGVGLHRIRLGIAGGFSNQVASNILVDNLELVPLFSRPGDFNNDDLGDARAYVVWPSGRGQSITKADYHTWRTHLADGAFAQAASALAPEPRAMVFYWLVYLWLASLSRQRCLASRLF